MPENSGYKGSFLKYLTQQRKLLLIASIIFVAIFLLLKLCFPLPDFFNDSFTYLYDAVNKPDISYRPLGYSNFLSIIHIISTNGNFAVFIQYLLFFISTLFCFFSCDYLYGFPPKLRLVVFYLALINPILIFQTNLISSDSLFCSLTVTWFTLCLWIIKRNTYPLLLLQAALLLVCFHVRYTAIFYPAVAAIVFLFSKGRMLYKVVGIILSITVVYFYVERQKAISEDHFNIRVFSGFSGWQMANNVLCYYKKIDVDPKDLPDLDTRNIDRLVKKFIDKMYVEDYVGTQYMWDKNSPLKLYVYVRETDRQKSYFSQWYSASKPLGDYGWAIIKRNPLAYVRYFIIPNTKNYFLPDQEALSNYNYYSLKISPDTKDWFGYDFERLYCRFPDLQQNIMFLYPEISFALNVFNIVIVCVCLFRYFVARKKTDRDGRTLFLVWCTFYFGFMALCLFSTIVLLRYLDPLFALGIIVPFLLLHQIKKTLAPTPDQEKTV